MLGDWTHTLKRALWRVDIDIKRRSSNSTLESNLVSLIELERINLIIDVGANIGQFALLCRHLGYSGIIQSFEPNPKCYSELQEKASRDKNWLCHQIAFASEAGELEFFRSDASVFSSFLPISQQGAALFPAAAHVEKVVIETVRADEFFSDIDPTRTRALLKIDTQGFDIEVFKGATRLLPSVRGIVSELSFIPVYQGNPDWSSTIKLFEEAGFTLSGMYPVTRTKALELVEADGVFCRKR
jgi:FkbM family methyltransferase